MTWLERIIPPDDPQKLAAWRLLVALAIVLLLANGAIGRAGLLGFGQYAYANDMAAQGEKIDRILTLQIADTLRQLREELCRANGNKALLEQTIETYQQQFIKLSGERYPLPDCDHT